MWPQPATTAGSSPARAPQAAWRVDKATSNLLLGPDWATNLEICDTLNTDVWQSKETVKAVKKRLLGKDPKVQFYALTLLETMMKNCGEYVHFEVVDQNLPQEMVKIIQKKCDFQVRDKILILLDCWQEAFGGPGGKFPQYYWAYIEVKRMGIEFPRRPLDAPIFTPPASHPSSSSRPSLTYGPSGSTSGSLNERMASENGTLSLSDLTKFRIVMELLNDMVQALKSTDQTAAKDEVVMDLVNQCRINQEKVMQLVSSTGNEELLKQGLELNDSLQSVLARHSAILSGAPLPVEQQRTSRSAANSMHPPPATTAPPSGAGSAVEQPRRSTSEAASSSPSVQNGAVKEEEEDDEFSQLARRKHKPSLSSDQASSSSNPGELALVPVEYSSEASSTATISRQEQDLIDLMSLSIVPVDPESSTSTSEAPENQSPQNQNEPSLPASSGAQYPPGFQAQPNPQNQQSYAPPNNYVAPWAQPAYPQPQQYASGYTAPPWSTPNPSANPVYQPAPAAYQAPPTAYQTQNPATLSGTPRPASVSQPAAQPMQRLNSLGSASAPLPRMNPNSQKNEPFGASRPYYMPDNLFGDLVDVKNYSSGGRMAGTGSSSAGASDTPTGALKK